MLASASNDKTVNLYNLNFEDLMEKGCNSLYEYLANNSNTSDSDEDRQMCGIAPSQK